jgi:uncharacterized protein (DUF427 family)
MGFWRNREGDFPFPIGLWYNGRGTRLQLRLGRFYCFACARTSGRQLTETIGRAYMAKAIWNGQTIAESDKVETIEGNIYFPEETVNRAFLRPSSTSSNCPWKGMARYYTVLVDGQENPDAAWYYPNPKSAAKTVKHHVAFWRGVEIIPS